MKVQMISQTTRQSRQQASIWILLLVITMTATGCKKGSVTVSVKAPCNTAVVQITDVTLEAHTTSNQTFFEFDFCVKCPGGQENQGVPVANLPVTISVEGTGVSQTVTSDANGCVKATSHKAVVDVGKGEDLNGKPVKITLEGSDGKKEIPGTFTLKGS